MKSHFQFLFLVLLVAWSSTSFAQWHQFSSVAMTTPINLVIWEESLLKAETISQEVFEEFDRIEQQMSRYIEDSELSLINRHAFEKEMQVSPSLFSVLNAAMNISSLSQGAFDISFASLGYMYDFRKKIKPTDMEIQQKLKFFHYQNISLDHKNKTIKFSKEGILIDLGGIAKGYAVDQGIEILKKYGVSSAHLSAGGDMRLLGDKQGAPWIIGIKNPRNESEQAIILPLSDTAVSTSGDYERFFMDDKGERIHHILSPKTGKPVKGIRSATILANEAITSDGLSTAVFVLGVQEGLALINKLNGVDAIIIDEFGKVHFSEGLLNVKSDK